MDFCCGAPVPEPDPDDPLPGRITGILIFVTLPPLVVLGPRVGIEVPGALTTRALLVTLVGAVGARATVMVGARAAAVFGDRVKAAIGARATVAVGVRVKAGLGARAIPAASVARFFALAIPTAE